MTIDHNNSNNMHRRLERHRRQKQLTTARSIRDHVERAHDAHLEPRLFGNVGGTTDDEPTPSSGDDGTDSSSGTRGSNSATARTSASRSTPAATRPSSTSRTLDTSTSSSSSSTSSSSSSSSTLTSSSSTSSTSSTRTSATSTSSSSSARERSTSSTEEDLPTSVASVTDANSLATSVRVITQSPTSLASATATPSSTSNDGPGAGLIIGVVAGGLAGLVVLAAAVSYLVKWYSNRKTVDPYEANPFDRDEFRRQSVMIPEGFESEDGHPSLSEHRNYGPGGGGGLAGGNSYEDDMVMAQSATAGSLIGHGAGSAAAAGGAAGAAAAAAGASAYSSSHNDSGRPRPPTMFARHTDAHAPSVGAVFNQPPVVPQLPPMAFGGGDPYSLAGVAGGMHNVSNPYAHLDRNNNQNGAQDQFNYPQHQQQYAVGGYSHSDGGARSNGSSKDLSNASPGSNARRLDYDNERYETSGRPGTAEGRSGTPDIPNVQQTYNLGGSEDGHSNGEHAMSPAGSGRQSGFDFYSSQDQQQHDGSGSGRGSWSPPQMFSDQGRSQDEEYFQQMQQQYGGGALPRRESTGASQSLQVRNLTHGGQQMMMPNPHGAAHGAARPASAVEDDDAAYGGVY